jgi:MYXO-CTERM domain-containing protein
VGRVLPTDGRLITGIAGSGGGSVVVSNAAGTELCQTLVASDGSWSCAPGIGVAEGDLVRIARTDPSGQTATVWWRVGLPQLNLAISSVRAGASQSVAATNFQPGELVTAVMLSEPLQVGQAVVTADGSVAFTWTVPANTAPGPHGIVLTGSLSGEHSATFEVLAAGGGGQQPTPTGATAAPTGMPVTGSAASGPLASCGLALALFGLVLLAASRRRQFQKERC